MNVKEATEERDTLSDDEHRGPLPFLVACARKLAHGAKDATRKVPTTDQVTLT